MKDILRVLLIPSSDYLGHPFPQRHNHLFERLHDGKEFEVHVVRFNIFGKPKLTSKCVIHEIPLEIRTHSTALYYLTNVASYTSEILRIVRRESIDIVVAGNLLPPLTYTMARQLTERRIPFIFDLQDYYPTSAAGYIADVNSVINTTLKRVFEAMTQHLIRISDAVTVPGIALATYARKVCAKNIHIIPNGISEHFLQKHGGTEIRKKLGFEDDTIVIGYIGSIEFWLDMEPLIKAIAEARRHGIPVKFLLVGKHLQTGYPRKVEKWIENYGVERITTWLDIVPHEEVPKYMAAMNVGTIPFDINNPTAYYAAPNKLWEYLSQGLTVISTPIPEAILHKNLVKIVHSKDDYVKLLSESYHSAVDVDLRKIRAFLKKRLWKNSVKMFKTVIHQLVAGMRVNSRLLPA